MDEINFGELKVGAYLRKSSDSEDKQVQSIETQEREVQTMSERFRFHLKNGYIYAETKSAFSPGRERFGQLLDDIESGKINALAVVNANRLARNSMDGARIVDLMDRKKLLAIFTLSKISLNNANDKMMLGLEFLMSKKDSDDKSVFVKNGLKTKALKGLPSGVAFIGFLNDFTNEKGNRKWKIDSERYPLVQALLKRFLQGDISASRLHRYAIKELKMTTPMHKRIGGALISRSRMYEILKDPIYAGFFSQGGVRYPLDTSMPRMITEDEHHRILQLLGARHMPKTKKYLAAYTGFIRSADGGFIGQDPKLQLICDCGKKFAYLHREICPTCGVQISDMNSPKYLSYTYYYNVPRKKAGAKARHLNERKIDAYLADYARKNLTFSRNLAEWSKKHIHELGDKEIQEKRSVATRKVKIKKDFEAKKARYRDMLAEGLITSEEYRTDMERLQQSFSSENERMAAGQWLERANEIVDLTEEFSEIIESGTVEAKRKVLFRLGSNLIWDEKKLSIINRKSVQALIDGLNRARRKNTKFEPGNYEANKDETEVFASVRPILLRTVGVIRTWIGVNQQDFYVPDLT
ncbi:MAG: hypothetical protein UW55_C0010G0013 [Candidatus Giovannonibacteria bacterium GW2011_GWA2_44_26]|uniref:Resolvase/invertase-type recombinase catalytic domain-containing protein n=1 Tax=Candidatus Giovannonibacteria bacterium GW2011_GWA2_44_26 TaxID=1618648 RepID=A0A0G1LSC9_9BACT|nr:MAG: hypothetical protein UW55_C0010G0013 [Candidatus Giovannonibacteria bacterium GW2011_GWA2_44_26]